MRTLVDAGANINVQYMVSLHLTHYRKLGFIETNVFFLECSQGYRDPLDYSVQHGNGASAARDRCRRAVVLLLGRALKTKDQEFLARHNGLKRGRKGVFENDVVQPILNTVRIRLMKSIAYPILMNKLPQPLTELVFDYVAIPAEYETINRELNAEIQEAATLDEKF